MSQPQPTDRAQDKLARISGLWTRTNGNYQATMSFVDQASPGAEDHPRRFVLVFNHRPATPDAPTWVLYAGNPGEQTHRITGLWPAKAKTGTISMGFTDPVTGKRYVIFRAKNKVGNSPDWIAYHDPVATAYIRQANETYRDLLNEPVEHPIPQEAQVGQAQPEQSPEPSAPAEEQPKRKRRARRSKPVAEVAELEPNQASE